MKSSEIFFREPMLSKYINSAAAEDTEEAYRAAFLAQSMGCDMIDVNGSSTKVIQAAVEGRNQALLYVQRRKPPMLIMASLTPPEANDLHAQKATLRQSTCRACGQCEKACPNNALTLVSGGVHLETTRCRGCRHCAQVCPDDNFRFQTMPTPPLHKAVPAALAAGAEAIELHFSGMPAGDIRRRLRELETLLGGVVLSVCLGSQQSSPRELIAAARAVAEQRNGRLTFIQADGSTMTGTTHGFSALSTAEIILSQQLPNLRVICSGGCGPQTWKFVREAGLPIAGIGMGIAMRECVKHLLDAPDLTSNPDLWRDAEQIHRAIVAGTVKREGNRKILGAALQLVANQ